VFCQQVVWLPGQRDQQVQRAPAQRRGLAVDKHTPLGRLQLEPPRRTETQCSSGWRCGLGVGQGQ